MKNNFQSPTLGELTFPKVLGEIFSFLSEHKKDSFRLIVGTDSKNQKNGRVVFVSILAVHRIGKGGKFYWQKHYLRNIHTLRHRIWQEVNFSLLLAQKVISALGQKHLFDSSILKNLEIHVDVGTHGETKDMIKELVGYVTQNGFKAKIKPESFGASIVADKFCH